MSLANSKFYNSQLSLNTVAYTKKVMQDCANAPKPERDYLIEIWAGYFEHAILHLSKQDMSKALSLMPSS